MSRRESPPIEPSERMPLRQLYTVSPVGVVGALVGGILITSFYSLGPVFANEVGLEQNQISNFMAIAIIAAMILAWPVGRLCDLFDRNRIMLVAATVAAVVALVAALLASTSTLVLLATTAVFIGLSATLYPISVRSEEHTSELQSRGHLVCRLLLVKKKPRPTASEAAQT